MSLLSPEAWDNISTLNLKFKRIMPRSTRLKELVRVVRQLIEHILNAAVPTDQRSELFKVLLKSKWPGILEADDVQDDITKNTAVIALSKSYKVQWKHVCTFVVSLVSHLVWQLTPYN